MVLTVYLAKVIGLALILIGAAILLRSRYFMSVVSTFARERMSRFFISVIELIAGLFLVVAHNVWTPLPAAIITAIGWLLIVEGLAYLALADETVAKMIDTVNRRPVYFIGGIVSILLGFYLASFGFGWATLY